MPEKNNVTIELMSRKEYFADAFNQYMYHGEQRIDPDKLVEMDTRMLFVENKSDKGSMTVERFRDILMYTTVMKDDRAYYVILGIENQSDPRPTMPITNLVYDALQLDMQVKDWKEHPERRGKLMPVVTLVIYFGEDAWTGPLTVEEFYDCDDPVISSLALHYTMNLIDPHRMTEEELGQFKTKLSRVMLFCKNWGKSREAQERTIHMLLTDPRFKDFEQDDQPVLNVINTFSGKKWNLPALKEGETMNFAEYIEERENAIAAKSKAEGWASGRAEGRAEGVAETLDKMIRNLKGEGIPLDTIARASGMPLEYVQCL